MKMKSQKGSITIFVLIALLFYMSFLLLLYAANTNKVQTMVEKLDLIKLIYEKNVDDLNKAYNKALAKNDKTEPTIQNIPDKIITNVTTLEKEYAQYGTLGGNTEYIAFGDLFTSLEEVINYATQNNRYGKTNVTINAYGNNDRTAGIEKEIEIIRGRKVTNEEELTSALASTDSLYISIANDIECNGSKGMDNVAHQLDLNNHTVSYTKQNESFTFLTIGSGGTLTILDSSEEKKGSVLGKLFEEDSSNNGADRENSIYTLENNGTLILQSGNIVADYYQHLNNAKDSIHLRGKATAIKNTGAVTVEGASVNTIISTNAISFGGTRDSEATGIGIENTGTANLTSGSITATADAYMQKQGAVYGETKAYAYGVSNTGGTINRQDGFAITVAATAHKKDYQDSSKTTTYKETQEQSEIKEN